MPNSRERKVPGVPPALRRKAAGAARWRAIIGRLAARGPVDLVTLETYCAVWDRWVDAERQVAKDGALVKTTGGSGRQKHPALEISREAQSSLRVLEARLQLDVLDDEAVDGPLSDGVGGVVTRRELAAIFRVHMMTITKWSDAGMPIAVRGGRGRASRYRVADVRAWHAQREADAAGTGENLSNGRMDVNQERARKERAQANLAEQSYRLRAGELLPRNVTEAAFRAENDAARAIILNSPVTHADRVFRAAATDGLAGVRRELERLARDVLAELSSEDRPLPAVLLESGRA